MKFPHLRVSLGNQLLFLFLVVILGLLTSHLRNGDVLFHTDLARDFLVMDEMVQTKKLTLIGGRSGGIPGVFHGPAWYYMSLPAFVLTRGDPVMMGWFWWSFGVVAVLTFMFFVFKLTKDLSASLLASLAFSIVLVPFSAGPVNNYVADLFSFLIFLVWWRWWEKPTFLLSLIGWFGLGFLVQFQMAFAVPLIFLWLPIFIWKTLKAKAYRQIPTVLILFIPISTFILFDLRHDFLQIKSVLQYVQGSGGLGLTLAQKVLDRLELMSLKAINIFNLPTLFAPVVMLVFAYIGLRTHNKQIKRALLLLGYLYFVWWALSLIFSGSIWRYYYSPFIGIFLFVIGLIAAKSLSAKILLFLLLFPLLISNKEKFFYSPNRFNSSSWKLLSTIAADGLNEPDQGYYLYSQDQFAYSLKYSFAYYLKRHPDIKGEAFKKKSRTVLVKAADDPANPFLTAEYWQHEQVRLIQEPILTKKYPFGYTLEIYNLDEKALVVPSDPNLIQNLHFR